MSDLDSSLPLPEIDLEKGIIPLAIPSVEDRLVDQQVGHETADNRSHKSSAVETMLSDEVDKPSLINRCFRAVHSSPFRRPPEHKKPKFPIIVREIEKCPYGYPYLAAFMESSEDFMIYRRFGFLHTRLLLQKQDQIAELEKALDYMDQQDKRRDTKVLKDRAYDEKSERTGKTRTELLAEIESTLLKYDQLLLNSQQLVASNRPTKREHNSVMYFFGHYRPLIEEQEDYIKHKEDLMTLRPGRETAWLDAFIMKVLTRLHRNTMKKIFYEKETNDKTKDPIFFLPRNSRVRRFVNGIVLGWVLVLFTVPIYALFHVGAQYEESNAKKIKGISMGILFSATTMFALGLWLFTRAKRHETLAASAAYCALLVVFIANLGADAGKKSASVIHGKSTHA